MSSPNTDALAQLLRIHQQLDAGERNIYEIADIDSSRLTKATFDQIMDNPDDVIAGVSDVAYGTAESKFGLFSQVLVKKFDDGSERVIFYTITYDWLAISDFFKDLCAVFGQGYDKDEFLSFRRVEDIRAIASFDYTKENPDVVHTWILDNNVSLLLQYKRSPQWEFSFFITFSKDRTKDVSVRAKGTIGLFINLDIKVPRPRLLMGNEIWLPEPKVYQYYQQLSNLQMRYFNHVNVTVHNIDPEKNDLPSYNVTLYHSGERDPERVREIIDFMVYLYGSDDSGHGALESYEWEIIDSGKFWTGRTWYFNDEHGLNNDIGDVSYMVSLSDDGEEFGFNLSIVGYPEMERMSGSLFDKQQYYQAVPRRFWNLVHMG